MHYSPGNKILASVTGVMDKQRQNVIAKLYAGESIKLAYGMTENPERSAIRVERENGEQIGFIDSGTTSRLSSALAGKENLIRGRVKEIFIRDDQSSDYGVRIELFVSQGGNLGKSDNGAGINSVDSDFDTRNMAGSRKTDNNCCPAPHQRRSSPDRVLNPDEEWLPTADYPYPYPFEEFNPVQSQVYRFKDLTDNLIISASTSAGKTIAAELLIDSTLAKNKKVIYLSPLKALTEEKYTEWKKRYFDKNLIIMTGDYDLSPALHSRLNSGHIVVMTSEMLDSRTRKFHAEKNYWMNEVGLVVVDESHILATPRGDAVETSIMRFTSHIPDARIVFLSATIRNTRELATWLTVLNGKKTDIVKKDWRPVQLQMNYPEYTPVRNEKGKTDYHETENAKIMIALDLVFSKPNEKFLIFVHSKKTGVRILDYLEQSGINSAFHNADLSLAKRRDVECRFRDRENGIRVLVSTSTTAWGVNLPARNVVIVGVHRGLARVDGLDIIQMAGRAGRYGIDDEGHVNLIIPGGERPHWMGVFQSPRPVTSVLKDSEKLVFHILAEICAKTIRNRSDLFNWYHRSLAHLQGVIPLTREAAEYVIRDLVRMRMIKERNAEFMITSLGRISAVMYFYPQDIYAWLNNFIWLYRKPK
jgi:replicative superfamily II helicase